MKKTLFLFVLLVLLVPQAASTQSTGVVVGNVDAPSTEPLGFAEVDPNDFHISGWALDCATGQRPEAFIVHFHRLGIGYPVNWTPANQLAVSPIYRPDVADAFRGACPSVTNFSTGYTIYVWPPPPPGYWEMWVVWANYNGGSVAQSKIIDVE